MNEISTLHEEMNEFRKKFSDTLDKQKIQTRKIMTDFHLFQQEWSQNTIVLGSKLKSYHETENKLQKKFNQVTTKNDAIKKRIFNLEARQKDLLIKKNILQEELCKLRKTIESKQLQWQNYKKQIEIQKFKNNPELQLYQKLLGFIITQDKTQTLTFQFDKFDVKDINKKCFIKIDVSMVNDQYHILETFPSFQQETNVKKLKLLHILNVEHDLIKFIIKSRQSLVELSLQNVNND